MRNKTFLFVLIGAKHLTKNFEVESVEYENTYEIHQDVDSGRAGRVAADPQKR